MSTKDFGNKVLETIKKENIKPKPRWEFLLKDYFLWALFIISVFVGSISVSIMIFMFSTDMPAPPPHTDPIHSLVSNIPYFWLLVLILFLVIAYLNFRYTKSGYRYNTLKVFLASIFLSLIFGSTLHFIGLSHIAERATYERLPFYKNVMEHRAEQMMSPEDGRLGGMLLGQKDNVLELKSFGGQVWLVDIASIEKEKLSALNLEPGIRIMILGDQVSENEFVAEQVMMWLKPPKHLFNKNKLNYLYERNLDDMRIIR